MCTARCRTARPGKCICDCQGEHHGEAAPVQQTRLGFLAPAAQAPRSVDEHLAQGYCKRHGVVDASHFCAWSR